MSKCECTMAIRVNGDGCRYCQPQGCIDRLIDWVNEAKEEIVALAKERKDLECQLSAAESKISEWEAAPDFVKAGDGTLHGAIDYWQDRAERAERLVEDAFFAGYKEGNSLKMGAGDEADAAMLWESSPVKWLLEKLKRPQKANAALDIINHGVRSVCDAVADKIIRGEK